LWERYILVAYNMESNLLGNENSPVGVEQEVFCIVVLITGAFLIVIIFGNITALMASLKSKDYEFEQ